LEDQLMVRLAGKVAVITGGSSGIGLATARRFVDEGAHVFIMGRRRSELDKAKGLIGNGLTTVAGDVTNSADLDKLFLTVLDQESGLDILVANSARAETEMLGKITEENFDATFNLNARATLFTVQKALPLIRTGGSVILIGSTSGYLGVPGYSAYSATKAALRSYTRTWTREFNDRGIQVQHVEPGPDRHCHVGTSARRHSSPRRYHSTGWAAPKRSQPLHCFWPPMTAASWPASN
jgi:NAD(P)-dependent dehydrogenase (short-subunit alcohol dehydrogenase family)